MAELKITNENFDTEVMQSELPVLLDFWATWCGPCRMLAPVVAEIAEANQGKLKVGKVNVDEEAELAQLFKVSSIPMLALMKGGKVQKVTVGYQSRQEIENWMK